MPKQPGYPDSWKKSVIQDTGKKLLVPAGGGALRVQVFR